MVTENPFVFGKATEGMFFTDRAEDVRRLTANLTHGINTILISSSMGKDFAIGTTGREFLSKISMFCLLFAIISGVYSCKSLEHKQEYTHFDEITRKNVYIVVEEMPQYKGGEGVFLKELANNVQYVYSENDNLQTRVQVQFVIDKKGQLIGARIYGKESDAISDFEKAVLKALCQTNDWQAGRQNGKPVNVLLTKAINICPNH